MRCKQEERVTDSLRGWRDGAERKGRGVTRESGELSIEQAVALIWMDEWDPELVKCRELCRKEVIQNRSFHKE